MEGNQESDNLGRSRCEYCLQSYSLNVIIVHECICQSNPANRVTSLISDSLERLHFRPVARNKNVPSADQGRNLIVVIGKDKSGKTTTIDNLLNEERSINPRENVPSSFRNFASPTKKHTLMEPYGNVGNLINGICLADFAILVIDSSVNFGTTHPIDDFLEPCSIAKSLGLEQLICRCNKMDLVSYSKEHYEKLKIEVTTYLLELGFNVSSIRFVPMVAVHHENITEKTGNLGWYKGCTLLEELDKLDSTLKVKKGLRMVIQSATNEGALGIVTGRVHSGLVEAGSGLCFFPGSWSAKVEKIRVNREVVVKAMAGEVAEIEVKGPLDDNVKRGCIVTSVCQGWVDTNPVKEALAFTAELLVIDRDARITQGANQYKCTLQESEFNVIVSSIESTINRRTGKSNPDSSVAQGGNLAVVFLAVCEAAVIEKACEHPSLGRIIIRSIDDRRVLAIGVVTDVETNLVKTNIRGAAGPSRKKKTNKKKKNKGR